MTKIREKVREWLKTRTEPFTAKTCAEAIGLDVRRTRTALDRLMWLGEVKKGEKLARRKLEVNGERVWIPIVAPYPERSGPGPACPST